MVGRSCIKHYARGQGVIALSSAEAEFYALASCAAQGMAEQTTARDLGLQLSVLMMDATAGIAIASRRGLGKVKHVDTQFLWVQEVIQNGKIKIRKKHTSEMLADVMTKAVAEPLMNRMLTTMQFEYRTGHHRLSLKV